MKTKHLLTAIALPALLAACTADELATVDNSAKTDLANRPVVENVKLTFGEANTRAVQGDKFNTISFVKGDKVGALQVDKYNGADDDPIQRYYIQQSAINTNYVFETQDGVSFGAEAYMTEGNYVFYYPFNGVRTRNQILTDLPTEQELTKGADGNYTSFPSVLAYSEENGAPLAIGYDFISASDADKTVQSTLKQIYAVPLITIVNGYTEKNKAGDNVPTAIKIKQIVLSKTNESKFTVKAPLKFSANEGTNTAYTEATKVGDGEYATAKKSIVAALFNEAIPSELASTTGKGFWLSSSMGIAKATSDIIGDATDDGTVSEIVLTLPQPVEVAADGSFSFYAVIPAENYGTNKLNVKVINDKGLTNSTSITLNGAVLYPGKRYPVSEYDDKGETTEAKGEALTGEVVDFDNTGVLVSTPTELINAVKNAAADAVLSIRLSGTATINSSVASYLKSTSTKATSITFVNAATFEGTGYSFEPAKNVTFSEGVTIKSGADVTLKSSNIIIAENKSLTIASGATLTYEAATLTGVTVKNNGTLKLAKSITARAINNAGEVSVTGNATVTTAEPGDGTAGDFNNGNAAKAAAVLNIAAGKTLTIADGAGKLINMKAATINNEGTLAANGLLDSKKEATINNGTSKNFAAAITDKGEPANVNAGTINNYGKVAVKTNTGVINMLNVNAKATVTAPSNGTINNNVLASVTNTGKNNVTYTLTGSQKGVLEGLKANSINTLILDGVTFALEANEVPTADVGNLEGISTVIISGSTSFSSNAGAGNPRYFQLPESAEIKLAENATLTVNAGVTIGSVTTGMTVTLGNNAEVFNYGNIVILADSKPASGWNVNEPTYGTVTIP